MESSGDGGQGDAFSSFLNPRESLDRGESAPRDDARGTAATGGVAGFRAFRASRHIVEQWAWREGEDLGAHITATIGRIAATRPPWAGLDLARPAIMGIVNVTPDSFSDGGETQNFFADLLVAPRVALQPLPPDPDHVQVRNLANLQLERQLGEPGGIAKLATQDVALVIKTS